MSLHGFTSSNWNNAVCQNCARLEANHSCESCSNTGFTDLIGSILMCEECITRHFSSLNVTPSDIIPSEESNQIVNDIEKLTNQVNRIADSNTIKNLIDEAIKGNVKQYKDYFNASMPSIISLKELIDSTDGITDNEKHYELARALSARIKHLTMVLVEFRSGEVAISAEVKSIQQYMNNLIPTLRADIRKEFAEHDITYKPPTIKSAISKVRLSTEDRLAEGYAKLMKISIEQAKLLMANKLRAQCSCKATPGVCAVHS